MSAAEPPLPPDRLSPGVKTLWRLEWLGVGAVALVVGMVLGGPLDGALATLAWVLPLVVGVAGAVLDPELRYRRWRFEVGAQEVDLRHGGLTLKRTLVPMRRVQHVDTSSGALEQLFDLATVTVHTSGGSVAIPGLEAARAWRVQQRIAEFARLTDDD